MKKIYCGQSGSAAVRTCHRLSDIPLPEEILSAFLSFYGEDILLRPAQENALFENDILNCADNLIIATPTNSGKSLLSYLLLFQEAAKGSVSVVLFPPLMILVILIVGHSPKFNVCIIIRQIKITVCIFS